MFTKKGLWPKTKVTFRKKKKKKLVTKRHVTEKHVLEYAYEKDLWHKILIIHYLFCFCCCCCCLFFFLFSALPWYNSVIVLSMFGFFTIFYTVVVLLFLHFTWGVARGPNFTNFQLFHKLIVLFGPEEPVGFDFYGVLYFYDIQ